METKDLLRQNPVFDYMDDRELDSLLGIALTRQYHKGQYLTHAGDAWPYIFFLIKGSVSAVKESSEGRSFIATSFKSGEVFWGVSFFHPELTMPVALKADLQSSVLLWSREQILPAILENGQVSGAF